MSTEDDGDWSLWQGKESKFMQVWPRDVAEHMGGANILNFITYGDKETLVAILELNNAHIRAQHGESNEP